MQTKFRPTIPRCRGSQRLYNIISHSLSLFLSFQYCCFSRSLRPHPGHVNLTSTSDFKYTCVKIHFVGLVTTKVAKIEEQTYVLNQQLVLLGHANNSTEYVLEEGKYNWPFQFTIPFQHLPSSGKVNKTAGFSVYSNSSAIHLPPSRLF